MKPYSSSDFDIPELHTSNKRIEFNSIIRKIWTKFALTKIAASLSTSKIPILSFNEASDELQEVYKSKSESATFSFKIDIPERSLIRDSSMKSHKNLRATTAVYSLPDISDSVLPSNEVQRLFQTNSLFDQNIPCSSKQIPLTSPENVEDGVPKSQYKMKMQILQLSDLKNRLSCLSKDDSALLWRTGATRDFPQKVIKDDLYLLKTKLQEVFGRDVEIPSVGPEAGKVITSRAYVPALPGYQDFSCSALFTDAEIADFALQLYKNKAVQADLTHGFRKETLGRRIIAYETTYLESFDNHELVDYRVPCLTAFFRDQVRRIDMVLVLRDSNNKDQECIKRTFLINLQSAGLDLELEPGVLKKNENLLFVKVHAPNDVIVRSTRHYNINKYFKNNHLDFSKPSWKKEKEVIAAIRENYPGPNAYSTFERIQIVYKILLSTRFGPSQMHYGLNRLLDKGLIKDAYPLHDGPYFILEKPLQEGSYINGRQVLFDRWIGFVNFRYRQPLNTIREYLGERVAFLFAYYEYYNRWLFLPGVAGIVVFISSIVLNDSDYVYTLTCEKVPYSFKEKNMGSQDSAWPVKIPEMQYDDLPVCPKCDNFAGCPFVNLSNYCTEITIKTLLDSEYVIPIIMFTILYFMMFARLWRRKERYFYWLWEVREGDAKHMLRAEFDYSFDFHYRPAVRTFAVLLVMLTFVYLIIPLFIVVEKQLWFTIMTFFHYERNLTYANYMVQILMSGINTVFILFFEIVFIRASLLFSHWLYSFRTEQQYEGSFIKHMYGFTFLTNFGFLFYLSFLKGLMYRSPYLQEKWTLPYGIGTTNCGPCNCMDEIFIVYIFTLTFKRCFVEVYSIFFRRYKSDYEHGGWYNQNVPCWEKEYDLIPITEKTIMKKYNYLMIQMALMMFFVYICPIMTFFIFLLNIFEIRYWAKVFLLKSRRPLLLKTWGLGGWHLILQSLPYAASLWNIASVARQSNFLQRMLFETFFNDLRYQPDYAMGVFFTSSFKNGTLAGDEWIKYANAGKISDIYPHWKHAHFCLYPGMYSISPQKAIFWNPSTLDRYTPHVKHNYLHLQSIFMIVSFQIFVILTGILLNILLHPVSEIIRNSLNVETMMKNARVKQGIVKKDE